SSLLAIKFDKKKIILYIPNFTESITSGRRLDIPEIVSVKSVRPTSYQHRSRSFGSHIIAGEHIYIPCSRFSDSRTPCRSHLSPRFAEARITVYGLRTKIVRSDFGDN